MLQNYRIERQLGSGEQGSVYLAYRIKDDKKMVIKSIKLSTPQRIDLFERECGILNVLYGDKACEINHVLCIIEYFIESGNGYIVTEYHENSMDLYDYALIYNNVITDTQFIDITLQLLNAIKYIHSFDMIHMDIKLENILVYFNGNGNLQVMLLDFGLSCKVDGCKRAGTPNYVAPEVYITHMEITKKVDIFSLGVALFLLLTRNYPYYEDEVSDWVQSRPTSTKSYPEFDTVKYSKHITKYPFISGMIDPNPDSRKGVDELIEQVLTFRK